MSKFHAVTNPRILICSDTWKRELIILLIVKIHSSQVLDFSILRNQPYPQKCPSLDSRQSAVYEANDTGTNHVNNVNVPHLILQITLRFDRSQPISI